MNSINIDQTHLTVYRDRLLSCGSILQTAERMPLSSEKQGDRLLSWTPSLGTFANGNDHQSTHWHSKDSVHSPVIYREMEAHRSHLSEVRFDESPRLAGNQLLSRATSTDNLAIAYSPLERNRVVGHWDKELDKDTPNRAEILDTLKKLNERSKYECSMGIDTDHGEKWREPGIDSTVSAPLTVTITKTVEGNAESETDHLIGCVDYDKYTDSIFLMGHSRHWVKDTKSDLPDWANNQKIIDPKRFERHARNTALHQSIESLGIYDTLEEITIRVKRINEKRKRASKKSFTGQGWTNVQPTGVKAKFVPWYAGKTIDDQMTLAHTMI